MCTTIAGGGCMPQMSIEEFRTEMGQFQPSPQIKQLQPMVGEWSTDMLMHFAFVPNESISAEGAIDVKWDMGGMYLVIEGSSKGELGEYAWREMISWDGRAEEFRYWSFGSRGDFESGGLTIDPVTGEMRTKGTGRWPDGTPYSSKGSFRMDGPDMMKMTYTITDRGGMKKLVEMTSTARRRS
jgi:hypothetical protein